MKRKVSIGGLGPPATGTIVIDKDGLRVIDKSANYLSDSEYCKSYLTQLIDSGGWNHSWHMDVSNAKYKSSPERKQIREILKKKITEKEEAIQKLKDGLQILEDNGINVE